MSMKSGQMRTRVSEESAEFNWGPLWFAWEFFVFGLINFGAMVNDLVANGFGDPWAYCSLIPIFICMLMIQHIMKYWVKDNNKY